MPIVGDPARPALLALHYQNEVLHPDGAIRMGVARGDGRRAGVVERGGALLAGARGAGVPVLHVRIAFAEGHRDVIRNSAIFRAVVARAAMVDGTWGADFHAGLEPREGEAVITHGRVDAFHGTDLRARLEALGVGHVVMAGVATHSVVETTFRTAADIGWLCTVAADACSSGEADLHAAALRNMGLLGEVAPAAAILARGFAPGKEALAGLLTGA